MPLVLIRLLNIFSLIILFVSCGGGEKSSFTIKVGGTSGTSNSIIAPINPTILQVTSSSPNASYNTSQTINIDISFSAAVFVTGIPQIQLETGATDQFAIYTSGSGTSILTFSYTVQTGDTSADLDYLSSTALGLNGGTINASDASTANLTLALPGAANSLGANKAIVVSGVAADVTAPTVISVSSATVNGSYKMGDTINVTIFFSEAVNVTGTPRILLETGATDQYANYVSGTGSSTLNFTYTVAAGDISSDLDFNSTAALGLNGGTIADAALNNATLTLVSPGAANSLGANKAIIIDTIAPTVTSVSSATVNGSYGVASSIDVNVTFSETVNVTGIPRLLLETGTTDQYATYASGTGTNTLTFNYTISTGDTSNDLDYNSTIALELNTGTINDAALNPATLTLAAPGAANSLGNNKAIIIDGTAPTVSSISASTANGNYKAGDTITVTATFSEIVNVTGTPRILLETGATDEYATYASGSGSTTLNFSYTVQAGDNSNDLDFNSTTALGLNGGTISDAALNSATLTLAAPGAANSLGANKAIIVDTVSPTVVSVSSATVNGSYKAGDSININVTFSEIVNVSGNPRILLETGATDQYATYTSGTGSTILNFTYTVQAADTSSDLDFNSTTALGLNGGTIADVALNNATLSLVSPGAANSLGANKAIIIDTTAPTVTSVSSSTANGSYMAGENVLITINFSEAITVSGTPRILLETGTTDQYATYTSGSTSTALTFTYTVQAGDTTNDLDYTATTSLGLNGGTIRDVALNNASLTLAAPAAANSLGNNKAIIIDTTKPVFTAASFAVNNGVSPIASFFVPVDLVTTDTQSNISFICLKFNDSTLPTSGDGCWVAVNNSSYGVSAALSVTVNDYMYQIGSAVGVYTIYGWARDAAGNISTNTSTDLKDKASITFDPGNPPVISKFIVANTDTPSLPVPNTELQTPSASTVYIKWQASDTEGLAATPISLYYSTDGLNFTNTIATNLTNGQNGACTVDHAGSTYDDGATGCYAWTSPTNNYYKIRIVVTDNNAQTATNVAAAMNSPNIQFIAGNTDPSLGESAKAVNIKPWRNINVTPNLPSVGSFVVANNGEIYFFDSRYGILKYTPTNGKIALYIPQTGTSSGDGGLATSATLTEVYRMEMDHLNRVLIFEGNRIRRVDLSTNIITTFIGGNGTTASTGSTTNATAPLSEVFKVPDTTVTTYYTYQRDGGVMVPMPNGDLYFINDGYGDVDFSAGMRVRKYQASDNKIYSLNGATGINTSYNIGWGLSVDVSLCNMQRFGIEYDKTNSAITGLLLGMVPESWDPDCLPDASNLGASASFAWSNTSLVTQTPVPPDPIGEYTDHAIRTGLNGKIYIIDHYTSALRLYDRATNAWTTIAGTGQLGDCVDGTVATSCAMKPLDIFITQQNRIYFLDGNLIRYIDESNKVRTVIGQDFSSGDGKSPLLARFGLVNNIFRSNAGEFILLDSLSLRIRGFSKSGNLSTIAGNGIDGDGTTGVSATTSQLLITAYSYTIDDFVINPVNGDIFKTFKFFSGNDVRIGKLDRSIGQWTSVVGGGATDYPSATTTGANTSLVSVAIPPSVVGWDGTKIAVHMNKYNDVTGLDTNAMLKLYDSASSYTQSHLLGKTGNARANVTSFCTDGSNATVNTGGTACTITGSDGANNWLGSLTYDSVNTRWIIPPHHYNKGTANASQKIIKQISGGLTGTFKTMAQEVGAFVYSPTANLIFYCNDSGQIKKYNTLTDVETTLSYTSGPSIQCAGRKMQYYFDGTDNRLVFIYKENELYGIAEYINP